VGWGGTRVVVVVELFVELFVGSVVVEEVGDDHAHAPTPTPVRTRKRATARGYELGTVGNVEHCEIRF